MTATTPDTPSTEATLIPSTLSAETIVPVPDDRVPGIDSDDPFCRAWSEFAVSIAFEREVFVADVIGPFARRADRASGELRAVGLSTAQIDALGDLWLMALVDTGVDDPEIDVVVPEELVDAVAAAVDNFSTDVPAIAEDPSLVTQASSPATFEYLSTNCPDQGILAGNDAIE